MARYYNARVKHLYFKPSDLVLRKNSISWVEPHDKLNPKWEGPYRVAEINVNGYCKLAHRDGILVPRTWHTENRKLYYVWQRNRWCIVYASYSIFYCLLFNPYLSSDPDWITIIIKIKRGQAILWQTEAQITKGARITLRKFYNKTEQRTIACMH